MANQTTTTSMSPLIASETIANSVVLASMPKTTMLRLVHHDSIDGLNTLQKNYPVASDPGVAGGGSEGIDIGVTYEESYGTTVEVTPTEAAVDLMEISFDAIQVPNFLTSAQVMDLFNNLPMQTLMSVLRRPISNLTQRRLSKAESSCIQTLSGLSTNVGTLTSVNSFSNMLNAIFNLDQNEPVSEDRAFVLPNVQIAHLRAEALVTSGGLGAALLFQQADASVAVTAREMPDSKLGSFLGIPVYRLSPGLASYYTLTSGGNTGYLGGLIVPGYMRSPDDVAGAVGHAVYVEGTEPQFGFDVVLGARAIQVLSRQKFAVAELKDAHGISIYSKTTIS